MVTQQQLQQYRRQAGEFFAKKAKLVITPAERERIEIADFGLSQFEATGLGVLVYVNTQRCCAKELMMTPGQICPEHRHPAVDGEPGKEETFRCRWGTVYLHVAGAKTAAPHARPPAGRESTYTVWHEVVLRPGDQYTLLPDTLHWFQAGPLGAIVSEFSTRSTDENDIFTDPRVVRAPKVE